MLLEHHRCLLEEESGISQEVITTRGYESLTTKAGCRSRGFSPSQCLVPALDLPIHSATGEIVNHQLRPDSPRIVDGKPVKYETPRGSRMVLDVHLSLQKKIKDPAIPLFVTEGIRKADSAISHGACCIALLGVWNFRGTNEFGGKTVLPDWESIALNGRQVHIVFDSDVMTKRSVYEAMRRLKAFLESRGAKVSIIYLPPQSDGRKMGLDDFLVQGHTVEELLQHASTKRCIEKLSFLALHIGHGYQI